MFSDSKKAQPSLTNAVGAPSIISQSLTITGNLKTTGDLQVDGAIIGDVSAARVLIGDTAKVHGEVVAEEIIVRGEARGALKGGIVEITRTARVHGDIEHESLAIESGAQVDGTMKHTVRSAVVALTPEHSVKEPQHRQFAE